MLYVSIEKIPTYTTATSPVDEVICDDRNPGEVCALNTRKYSLLVGTEEK